MNEDRSVFDDRPERTEAEDFAMLYEHICDLGIPDLHVEDYDVEELASYLGVTPNTLTEWIVREKHCEVTPAGLVKFI